MFVDKTKSVRKKAIPIKQINKGRVVRRFSIAESFGGN